MVNKVYLPGIGLISEESGFLVQTSACDGMFSIGSNGVTAIASTGDGKVSFVAVNNQTIACVSSSLGYPAMYPVHQVELEQPVKAVLMDLDGTSVKSEDFWIWIIQLTIASLLKNKKFSLEEADIPYVSGHSVSEHLQYCIDKYSSGSTIEEARDQYYRHTQIEMQNILDGKGRENAFVPAEGLKDFLLELKSRKIMIGLVTSGLFDKAWPEIISVFKAMKMEAPIDFYDAIITAGYPLRKGRTGTLGELCPKPHPWLYAETARVGLGLDFSDRHHVLGIEDSGAGIVSVRLAGFSALGVAGGNIEASGTKGLCRNYCHSFEEILRIIEGNE